MGRTGVSKLWPMGQICLKQSLTGTHLLTYLCIIYGCLFAARAKLNRCDRDHMTHKAENSSIWLFLEKVCKPLGLTHMKHHLSQSSSQAPTMRTIDMHPFIHSFLFIYRHSLGTYYVPGTILGCLSEQKRQKFLSSWSLLSHGERQTINNKQNKCDIL